MAIGSAPIREATPARAIAVASDVVGSPLPDSFVTTSENAVMFADTFDRVSCVVSTIERRENARGNNTDAPVASSRVALASAEINSSKITPFGILIENAPVGDNATSRTMALDKPLEITVARTIASVIVPLAANPAISTSFGPVLGGELAVSPEPPPPHPDNQTRTESSKNCLITPLSI